jgi:hypothetical protein
LPIEIELTLELGINVFTEEVQEVPAGEVCPRPTNT